MQINLGITKIALLHVFGKNTEQPFYILPAVFTIVNSKTKIIIGIRLFNYEYLIVTNLAAKGTEGILNENVQKNPPKS